MPHSPGVTVPLDADDERSQDTSSTFFALSIQLVPGGFMDSSNVMEHADRPVFDARSVVFDAAF